MALVRRSAVSAGFFALLLLVPQQGVCAEPTAALDRQSGLIIAPGWETVNAHCTVCHSAKFITFQRGDRETWTSMIRWMQSTQGLWPLDEQTEDTILTYLAENYPPGKPSRRKNLPARDLPVQRL
jgi:hypothetical protein